MAEEKVRIPFHFSPLIGEDGRYSVMKEDNNGKKRRYLRGISSGVKFDAHEERMTEKCVKSFMNQANAGNVLLYPDIHGIKSSEDIGILVNASIEPNGDWLTEYRLYDEMDGVDSVSTQKADKLWKQVNGLAPYRFPMKKGFSIEGFVPDGAIISARKSDSGMLTNRVIDDVQLDGVVVVPRPAYKDSIANAVYKALGEINPFHQETVRKIAIGEFDKVIKSKEVTNEYFRRRWEMTDALELAVQKVMRKKNPLVGQELEVVFKEFSAAMIPLILKSESLFHDEGGSPVSEPCGKANDTASKVDVLKALYGELEKLSKII